MVLYLGFRVWNRYFCQWQDWNSSKITLCGEITRWRQVKQFSCEVFFLNSQSWRTLASFGHYCVPMHTNLFKILCFSYQGKRYRRSVHMLNFVVNIRPARSFWNSNHCLFSPFTLDWSLNLLHNPMWNMAVNNISYSIYPLSTRTEKGYITKIMPFCFVQYTRRCILWI